jgi:tRNA(adenine34) deaminase
MGHESGAHRAKDESRVLEVRCAEPEVAPAFTAVETDRDRASTDAAFMRLALEEARRAEALDEVPIGAVIVLDGRVIARAHNLTRTHTDPTAHAELLAIRAACRELGLMRIPGAVVYTTVEPCFMCAGALSQARVERVVWAVRDPKFGGAASLGEVLSDPRLNHRVSITEGVCAGEARELLQEFFRKKRGYRE